MARVIDLMCQLVEEEAASDTTMGGVPESYLHIALEQKLGIGFSTRRALVQRMVETGRIKRTESYLLVPAKGGA
jgi:hypothetical protein